MSARLCFVPLDRSAVLMISSCEEVPLHLLGCVCVVACHIGSSLPFQQLGERFARPFTHCRQT